MLDQDYLFFVDLGGLGHRRVRIGSWIQPEIEVHAHFLLELALSWLGLNLLLEDDRGVLGIDDFFIDVDLFLDLLLFFALRFFGGLPLGLVFANDHVVQVDPGVLPNLQANLAHGYGEGRAIDHPGALTGLNCVVFELTLALDLGRPSFALAGLPLLQQTLLSLLLFHGVPLEVLESLVLTGVVASHVSEGVRLL